MTPQQACEDICRRIIKWHNGDVNFSDKFVAVNKNGLTGCAQVRGRKGARGPSYTVFDNRGNESYYGVSIITY